MSEKYNTSKIRTINTNVASTIKYGLIILFFLLILFLILWPILWGTSGATTVVIAGNTTNPFETVTNLFAKTITQKDVLGNINLFIPTASVTFYRLMTFIPTTLPLTLTQWGEQLEVFFGEYISNHMTLSNPFNVTATGVSLIGYYTYTLDVVGGNNTNLPSTVCSFTVNFGIDSATKLLSSAVVLPNATCTFIWYSSSGVEAPGPILTKKNNNVRALPDATKWTILQSQINALITTGDVKLALSICNTTQYLTLKAIFDPMGTNPMYACNTQQLTTQLTVPTVCSGDGSISLTCLPTNYPQLTVGVLNVANLTCPNNTMIDNDECFPQRIATINVIPAFAPSDDFVIQGGPGIQITGLPHGLQIRNLGVLGIVFLSSHPEFNATFINNILYFQRLPQLANQAFLGPASGPPSEPYFRYLVDADITNVSATKILGVLSIEQGGTNSGTALVNGKIMISSGGQIIEGPDIFSINGTGIIMAGDGISITIVNGSYVISAIPDFDNVTLSAPTDIFQVNSPAHSVGNYPLSFEVLQQIGNKFWASPANGATGVPMFRAINILDLPTIPMTSLTGILPISKGGTNSGTSLTNNKIMISYGGQIVESLLVNGTGITTTVADGYITINNDGLLSLTLLVPLDIFSIAGSPTSGNTPTLTLSKVVQTQKTFYAGPITGIPADPAFRPIETTDLPPIYAESLLGILPVLHGGTGSNATLVGNRLMQSTASQTIVEFPAMFDGQVVIGKSGDSPQVAYVTAGNGVSIVTGPGSLLVEATGTCANGTKFSPSCLDISGQTCSMPISNACIPSGLVLETLVVSGATILGNSTSCSANLNGNCVDISNESCPGGAVGVNCIPTSGLILQDLFVYNLTAVTSTQLTTLVANASLVTTAHLNVQNIELSNTLTCVGGPNSTFGTISPNCYDISGKTCMTALDSSCIPSSLITNNLQSTGTFTVNNMVCSGPSIPDNCVAIDSKMCTLPISDSCTPIRIKTINGISPTSLLDFGVVAGTGISITPGTNLITVANTGVTSVGLSTPSEFTVTVSPITTTGTLTFIKSVQSAHYIWAGPTSGLPAIPTFRLMDTPDLPALPAGELWIGTGSAVIGANLTAGANILITHASGSITITGTGVSSISMTVPTSFLNVSPMTVTSSGTFAVTLISQLQNLVFASPSGSSGVPTFRSLVILDLPSTTNGQLYIGNGAGVTANTLTAGDGILITNGAGTIMIAANISIGMTVPSSFLSVTPTTATNGQTFAVSLISQSANRIFASPDNAAGVPSFRAMVTRDMPALGNGQIYIGNAGLPTVSTLSAGTGITITPGMGTLTVTANNLGTVTSVGLSLPSILTVTVSPITTSGTLTAVLTTQLANRIFAGPTSGGAATPTFRAMVTADLPSLTNGQLFIGNGAGVTANTLTAGSGITITNTAGNIQINATTGAGSGTVTSVGLSLPSIFNVSGSPVTTSGTLTAILATQSANTVFAGPTSGGAATPTFRALVAADLPAVSTLTYSEVSSTTTISTFSSAAYTVATTMTVTPAAGTYQVSFSTSIQPSNSAGVYKFSIFNGATQLLHSVRTSTGSSGILIITTQGVVVANGSDAITLQWQKSSGSGNADMFERSMFLLRIA